MSNSRVLTLQQLKDADACNAQVSLFQQTFGASVEVTVELAEQYAQQFDFDFAARHFLTAAAYAEYDKVRAAARAEYNKVRAPAYAEYYKVTAAAAWAEYDKVIAAAFAAAYINDK
jgi:hypothetical protein